ncbi:Fur family transcriptional regulator [Spiroplasma corruscae]|uniref:Fur family transcriptional regulator n=1 Tax=Spiroplasma corruscae TaxID=216934 RepID=A0A222ENQ1_9MOLU|nr:transcriptional repressor [Spiroplasma corruscae]ASP27914.1 Fur family transcriptional regulator [Spiroplasma corruscae]
MNNDKFEKYISLFKSKKIKLTDVRLSMLKAITTKKHLTIPELIEFVQGDLGTVNVMSIYNNVDLFLELHLLFSNSIDGKQIMYEVISPQLVHICCDECGKIIDLEDEDFNKTSQLFFESYLKNKDMLLVHSKIELHIICESCKILKK